MKRIRIVKPEASAIRARKVVRELYSDLIEGLSNAECDKIISCRRDGLGDMTIVSLIAQKRQATANFLTEREQLYNNRKSQQAR